MTDQLMTYDYFMAALEYLLNGKEITQKEISDITGTAAQTISAFVNRKKTPGLTKQEEIAGACGYEYLEFIQFGKELLQSESPEKEKKMLDTDSKTGGPDVRNHWALPNHQAAAKAVNAVMVLVEELKDAEAKVHFWHKIFDMAVAPLYITQNGIVVAKNNAARNCGQGSPIGELFGDGCEGDSSCCKEEDECVVYKAIQTGMVHRFLLQKEDAKYLCSVNPFFHDGHNYHVIAYVKLDDLQDLTI